MSLISRLEAQNSRIWRYIVAESTTLADGRDWIPEDRLMSIWTRPISGEEHKNELDEFQECVSSTDLARNLYSAIKTISILICIRWHQWHEFAERFCRLTGKATLDDLQDIDDRLPFTKESLQYLLFPDSSLDANSFFVRQYAFLPLVLEENQTFRSYQSEYRLPLLDEAKLGPIKQRDRLITVKIAEGCFRFARREEFNSTVRVRNLAPTSHQLIDAILAAASSSKESP